MPDSMTTTTGGSESEDPTKGWQLQASLGSLVLGLVAYATGLLMYSYGWHHMYWFGMGESRLTALRMWEWGQWTEGAGIILVILGLVFYVAGRRKGV
jgi:hypothetical protein